MDIRIQLIAIAGAGGLLLLVLELVRRRALLERYALLWLFSALFLLVLAVWRDLLERVADALGIAYAPNALFFLAFAAILLLLLHFSIAVSRLADQSKILAQRLAMVDERLRRHEQGAAQAGADADADAGEADELSSARAGRAAASRR
jgi:hypothetical protein